MSEYSVLHGDDYPMTSTPMSGYMDAAPIRPKPGNKEDEAFVKQVESESVSPATLLESDRTRLDYFRAHGHLGEESNLYRDQGRMIRGAVLGFDPNTFDPPWTKRQNDLGGIVIEQTLDWMRVNGHPTSQRDLRRMSGEVSVAARDAMDQYGADNGIEIDDTPGEISLMSLSVLDEVSILYSSGDGPVNEEWVRLGDMTQALTELHRAKGDDIDFARQLDRLGRPFSSELDLGSKPRPKATFAPVNVYGSTPLPDFGQEPEPPRRLYNGKAEMYLAHSEELADELGGFEPVDPEPAPTADAEQFAAVTGARPMQRSRTLGKLGALVGRTKSMPAPPPPVTTPEAESPAVAGSSLQADLERKSVPSRDQGRSGPGLSL